MIKKRVTTALFAVCLAVLCVSPVSAWAEVDHIVDHNYDDPIQPIPQTYTLVHTISYLGETFGTLNAPQDLFVAADDTLYIADSGNNRILHFDAAYQPVQAVEGEADSRLSNPQSVFVDEYGGMYVADTGHSRIVKFSKAGKYVEEFGTPKSDVLADDFVMSARRISVSSTGSLYVIRNQYVMQMDAYNNFRGYISVNDVGFDLWYKIQQLLSTEKQKYSMQKREPASCLSFDVAADGTLYVTTAEASGQLKKISSISKNIYPKKDAFGATVMVDGVPHTPYFVDLAVAQDDTVFMLESWGGEIHAYDAEGNNLTVFGGIGESADEFSNPIAVDTDSRGYVYVLDAASNCVKIFAPTYFMNMVLEAVSLYGEGKYVEAVEYWEAISEIDSNYSLANKGFAKAYFKQKKFKTAMEYYELCNDKSGYSEAFTKYRLEVLRQYFGWVLLVAAVLLVAVIFIIKYFMRWVGKVIRRYYNKI
ncbi:MAG: SMP-30/gluconolactonase/LRE family protein [Clostridia bacterium]|nr:SMP-30/gluconolactonase/LRE family protein [Clostridia bacterium]